MAETEVHVGSGNIFVDMGLPHPEERLAKAEVSIRVEELRKDRRMTDVEAGALMGLSREGVSDLVRGNLSGFTLDRLFQCLMALGQDVEITIRPKAPDEEFAHVLVAH